MENGMGYGYVHTTINTHMRDIIYNMHLHPTPLMHKNWSVN